LCFLLFFEPGETVDEVLPAGCAGIAIGKIVPIAAN
jgi:hypothetical protein